MQRRPSRIIPFVFVVALVSAALYGLAHWQTLFDWWRLRNYQPPAAIAKLADETTMTTNARQLFYVYYPELDDKAAFNQHCTTNEQSIVLGCYVSGRGIYLYDVQDSRLQGVQQVTAAHEMLHAAYDRLDGDEQQRIDALTQQTFDSLTDQRVKETVERYRQKDPGVVPNELHSILATEVRELPPDLEQYYQRYFIRRAAIIDYSEKYEGEFTTRRAQIADYDLQLKSLKSRIEQAESTLESMSKSIADQRKDLDALLAARNYGSYNARVDSFNAQIRQYNSALDTAKSDIATYNDLVQARNAIAVEEQDLVKALDSRLQTQPAH